MKRELKRIGLALGFWLVLLTVALAGRAAWAGACTAARFNDWVNMGCPQCYGGTGGVPTAQCPCKGMPRWWVSEPYMSVCLKDTPLSYTLSSGQEMDFSFYYMQRAGLPGSDQVPSYFLPTTQTRNDTYSTASACGTNASWGNTWTESITIWDSQWEANWRTYGTISPPGYPPYSGGYEAFVWRPEGGINYYNLQRGGHGPVDPQSEVSITGVGQSCPTVEAQINGGHLTNAPAADANGIYWGDAGMGVKLVYPDGSQDIFGLSAYAIRDYSAMSPFSPAGASTSRLLLTQRIDPQGRVTQLGYENTGVYRVRYVVDPDLRTNTFHYNGSGLQLAEIDDPYGRKTTLVYNANRLSSLTDAAGMTSTFQYQAGSLQSFPIITENSDGTTSQTGQNLLSYANSGWVTGLTTPYGTTAFSYYEAIDASVTSGYMQRAVYVSEPAAAQQLFYYLHANPTAAANATAPVVPGVTNFDDGNSGSYHPSLNYRNTYHWGRLQFQALTANANFMNDLRSSLGQALADLTANDFNKAEMKHWLLSSVDELSITESVSSKQAPSPDVGGTIPGLRTWYDYPGKPAGEPELLNSSPQVSAVARLLPDGTSQYTTYHYYPVAPAGNGLVSDHESSLTLPNGSVGELTNSYTYAANGIDLTSISNSAGQFVNYGYNGSHQLLTLTNALNQGASLSWDPWTFNLTGIQWPNGKSATFYYYSPYSITPTNISSMIYSIGISPENRAFTFNNYQAGQPSSITDDRGVTLTSTYDGLNRLTGIVFPDATSISNIYSRLDVVAAKDRLTNWTFYAYDGLDHLNLVTNANNAVTTYSWCGCGSLTSIFDALGNTTSLNYDNQGNLTNITYPDFSSLTRRYDLAGRMTNATDGAHAFQFGYNNQGLVTTVASAYGLVRQTVYDAVNRPGIITDANGVTVTNTFDAINELLQSTRMDGASENFGYSAQGLVAYTNRDGKVTRFVRDAASRLTSVTNANLEVNQYAYDSLDHVLTLVDGLQHSTTWKYNEYGWLTNKVDGNSDAVLSYTYDDDGRVLSRSTPAMGATGYGYDGVGNLKQITYPNATLTYAYDALSRLTNMVDVLGTTAFGYTPAGQLQSETGPWASDTVTNGYAAQLRTGLSLAEPGGFWQQSYAYDAAARLTNVVSPAGVFGYALGGAGPASPLVQALALPNGGSITNGYDGVARLRETALNLPSGATLDGYGYQYDALGLRTNVTRNFGTATSSATAAYDALGQLTGWVGQEAGGAPRLNEQLGWGYDAADSLHTRANNALAETFTVDAANQLQGVALSGTLTVAGNTLATAASVTVNGQPAQLYQDLTFAGANQALANGLNTFTTIAQNSTGLTVTNKLMVNLPASTTLAYDANGNLTNDGLKGLSYDVENELTNVVVAGQWQSAFVYDGLGRRRIERDYVWANSAWVQTNEVHYIYDGSLILQERDANNHVLVTYTRGRDLAGGLQTAGGIGGLLARTDTNGSAFYHADALGNVTALINSSNFVVARYLYNPFGQVTAKWGPLADVNEMQFSSMPHHNPSGFSMYLYRAYDPHLQRWLNRDPLGEPGFELMQRVAPYRAHPIKRTPVELLEGSNLYDYVGNDPINAIDPLGLWTFGLGLSLNFQLGPVNFNWSGGFVIDGQGNVGTYTVLGGGIGAGAHASGGVSFSGSDAPNICDLRKGFYNANVGAGLGPDAEANGYYGSSPDGPVIGGGVTLGAGLGGGGSAGGTYTWVNPIGKW